MKGVTVILLGLLLSVSLAAAAAPEKCEKGYEFSKEFNKCLPLPGTDGYVGDIVKPKIVISHVLSNPLPIYETSTVQTVEPQPLLDGTFGSSPRLVGPQPITIATGTGTQSSSVQPMVQPLRTFDMVKANNDAIRFDAQQQPRSQPLIRFSNPAPMYEQLKEPQYTVRTLQPQSQVLPNGHTIIKAPIVTQPLMRPPQPLTSSAAAARPPQQVGPQVIGGGSSSNFPQQIQRGGGGAIGGGQTVAPAKLDKLPADPAKKPLPALSGSPLMGRERFFMGPGGPGPMAMGPGGPSGPYGGPMMQEERYGGPDAFALPPHLGMERERGMSLCQHPFMHSCSPIHRRMYGRFHRRPNVHVLVLAPIKAQIIQHLSSGKECKCDDKQPSGSVVTPPITPPTPTPPSPIFGERGAAVADEDRDRRPRAFSPVKDFDDKKKGKVYQGTPLPPHGLPPEDKKVDAKALIEREEKKEIAKEKDKKEADKFPAGGRSARLEEWGGSSIDDEPKGKLIDDSGNRALENREGKVASEEF